MDVGGGNHQDFVAQSDLYHIPAHFFGYADGGAGFAGSESVVEEEPIVGSLCRKEIADETLMGEGFERGGTQKIGLFGDVVDRSVELGFVEFFPTGNFSIEKRVIEFGVEEIVGVVGLGVFDSLFFG